MTKFWIVATPRRDGVTPGLEKAVSDTIFFSEAAAKVFATVLNQKISGQPWGCPLAVFPWVAAPDGDPMLRDFTKTD